MSLPPFSSAISPSRQQCVRTGSCFRCNTQRLRIDGNGGWNPARPLQLPVKDRQLCCHVMCTRHYRHECLPLHHFPFLSSPSHSYSPIPFPTPPRSQPAACFHEREMHVQRSRFKTEQTKTMSGMSQAWRQLVDLFTQTILCQFFSLFV